MKDGDFVVKKERGVLKREAFISLVLYHPKWPRGWAPLGAPYEMMITKGTLMPQPPQDFMLLPF